MHGSAAHPRSRVVPALLIATIAVIVGLALSPVAGAHHLSASVQLTLPTVETLTNSPDLYAELPTESASYGGTVPATFIDTDEVDGRLFYRFDAVIVNRDGTLDILCTNCDTPGRVISQNLWDGGRPPTDDDGNALPEFGGPTTLPTGDAFSPTAITNPNGLGAGGWVFYSYAQGHDHWHYDRAALYEMIVPNVGPITSAKTIAGFCFFDTYGISDSDGYTAPREQYFRSTNAGNPGTDPDDLIPDDEDWCRPGDDTQRTVRMGISPGLGDYYAAQLADQWVDITGVPAGPATLRATVNPDGAILESDYANNTLEVARVIPGATAAPITASLPANLGGAVQLGGSVVGSEVPIFLAEAFTALEFFPPEEGGAAKPCALRFGDCYAPADPNTLAFEIGSGPTNGAATITSVNGLTATLQYTPTPGFTGTDEITYITRDTRGLASLPATVTITVSNTPFNTVLPSIGGTPSVNVKLAAAPGSWQPAPSAYAYQWQRCDATGATCANIGGATGKTYVVRETDSSSSLRVAVTASNSGGAATATSAATAPVTGVARAPKRLVRKLFRGTRRADTITGTRKHDLIKSGGGGDKIRALAGRDIIKSGNGNDLVYAGRGKDVVVAGKGRDKVWARDKARDVINCGPGFDTVIADKIDKIHRSCEDVRRA